jgi:hypothetical protein
MDCKCPFTDPTHEEMVVLFAAALIAASLARYFYWNEPPDLRKSGYCSVNGCDAERRDFGLSNLKNLNRRERPLAGFKCVSDGFPLSSLTLHRGSVSEEFGYEQEDCYPRCDLELWLRCSPFVELSPGS